MRRTFELIFAAFVLFAALVCAVVIIKLDPFQLRAPQAEPPEERYEPELPYRETPQGSWYRIQNEINKAEQRRLRNQSR